MMPSRQQHATTFTSYHRKATYRVDKRDDSAVALLERAALPPGN
jgi:hypothetical protein